MRASGRKCLIVNGDDFGASPGINRGILEAHRFGILTSASLLVDLPASQNAACLAREVPELSVGLHVDLDGFARGGEVLACQADLHRQLHAFEVLMGRRPSHIDSHHNVHRDPRLADCFVALAATYGLPLREHCSVHYVSSFYGQWCGETHLEQISIQGLTRILAAEIQAGITELGCHPGYVDANFTSSYAAEREFELRTLCDQDLKAILSELGIELVSFRDLLTE